MTLPPKRMRAGGELVISAAQYADKGQQRLGLAARFSQENGIWTDTGRSALLLAAHAIRARGGRSRVWIPAFSCASVSQAWRQAGFTIQYYEAGRDLGRQEESSLPRPEPGETFLFIHYFGHHNTWMAGLADKLRAEGVWIVEDSVQGSLMPAAQAHGDFACTSYRKVLPVVDGAALFCREPVDLEALGVVLQPPDESFISARMLGKLLRGADSEASEFLPLLEYSEGLVDRHIVPRQMSWLSSWMLDRLDWTEAGSRRRANWARLAQKIAGGRVGEMARSIVPSLGDDDVPLGLPIAVLPEIRDQLREFLAANEIYCAIHWSLDHLPVDAEFGFERDLASKTLTLPIDQSMSFAQVDHVAERLAFFLNRT
jgi:dTDP-4-amino-4,6-dideoxygalactose transaminase